MTFMFALTVFVIVLYAILTCTQFVDGQYLLAVLDAVVMLLFIALALAHHQTLRKR